MWMELGSGFGNVTIVPPSMGSGYHLEFLPPAKGRADVFVGIRLSLYVCLYLSVRNTITFESLKKKIHFWSAGASSWGTAQVRI